MQPAAVSTIPVQWSGDRAFAVTVRRRRWWMPQGFTAVASPAGLFDMMGKSFWENGDKQTSGLGPVHGCDWTGRKYKPDRGEKP